MKIRILNFENKTSFKRNLKEHLQGGAKYLGNGETRFSIEAPLAKTVALRLVNQNDYSRQKIYQLTKNGDTFERTIKASPGDKYKYTITDCNNNTSEIHDPRADYLPNDIDEFKENSDWAQVIDHSKFKWTDEEWIKSRNSKIERGWHFPKDLVIESVNIGLLGGFKKAKQSLDKISERGIANAVRVMPIGEFYGDISWGYEEANKFAVENAYGTPDDFKDFVNYAHKKGIKVILDIVPNHFGPNGTILHKVADIFSKDKYTPWGKMLNFNGDKNNFIEKYMTDMLFNWAINYHVDGFRLDATHYVGSMKTLKNINEDLRSHPETKNLILYPEDMRLSRVFANSGTLNEVQEYNCGYNGFTTFDFYKSLLSLSANIEKNGVNATPQTLEHIFKNGIFESHEEQFAKGNNCDCSDGTSREFWLGAFSAPNFDHRNILVNISNHDEIGNNEGGKRNIVSIFAGRTGLLMRCNGDWRKANKLAFEMIKEYAETNNFPNEEKQKKLGCDNPAPKEYFENEFKIAFERNKAIIGTMFLYPSAKEFFMNDEVGELAPFKFFCNRKADDKIQGTGQPIMEQMEYDKGYIPDRTAFEDSKIDSSKYNIYWIKDGTFKFAKDISDFAKNNPTIKNATFKNIRTYAHSDNGSKLLELNFNDKEGNEIIAMINFGEKAFNSFKLATTAPNTPLQEVISSKDWKYNGDGSFPNSWKTDLTAKDVSIPAHGIVIFEKKK